MQHGMIEYFDSIPHSAIGETSVRTNDTVLPDCRCPFKRHIGIEDRIFSNCDPRIDPCGPRIDHGHPSFEPSFANLLANDSLGFGKLLTRIHAEAFLRLVQHDGRHTSPLRNCNVDEVSEIVLTLSIAWIELFQCIKQKCTVNYIGSGIDLANR